MNQWINHKESFVQRSLNEAESKKGSLVSEANYQTCNKTLKTDKEQMWTTWIYSK